MPAIYQHDRRLQNEYSEFNHYYTAPRSRWNKWQLYKHRCRRRYRYTDKSISSCNLFFQLQCVERHGDSVFAILLQYLKVNKKIHQFSHIVNVVNVWNNIICFGFETIIIVAGTISLFWIIIFYGHYYKARRTDMWSSHRKKTRAVRDCLILPFARISHLSYFCLDYESNVGHKEPIPVKFELIISRKLLSIRINSQIWISKMIWTTRRKSMEVKRLTT